MGEVFRRRRCIEQDRLVPGDAIQKAGDGGILPPGEEGVVPGIHDLFPRNRLDRGKIDDHAFIRRAGGGADRAAQRDFDGVTMPVQVAALAVVVGDAVAGVEFQPAGDAHGARIITKRPCDSPRFTCGFFAQGGRLQLAVEFRARFFQVPDEQEVIAADLAEGDALDMHDTQQFLHRCRHAASRFVAGAPALGEADRRPEVLLIESELATDAAGGRLRFF
jgi:hypothetical protein